jgi:hypothetical protein
LLVGAMAMIATAASASFHGFVIDQVYSSADGTVQFVVLREARRERRERLVRTYVHHARRRR